MIFPHPLLYSCSNQKKINFDLPMMFLTMLSLFFLHKYTTELKQKQLKVLGNLFW